MEGIYDIFRGGEKIGKAQVRREGLYYRFLCCCDLTGEVMYRLTVKCGKKIENLGIPVPDGDSFRLSARLPVSRFSSGMPEFQAVPKHQTLDENWVPLNPEVPFDYIHRLENAVLERRNNELGILIAQDRSEALPDSDPNPEHDCE